MFSLFSSEPIGSILSIGFIQFTQFIGLLFGQHGPWISRPCVHRARVLSVALGEVLDQRLDPLHCTARRTGALKGAQSGGGFQHEDFSKDPLGP